MNSKILYIILILPTLAFSQRHVAKNLPGFDVTKQFHFGFYLGINNLDFNIQYKPEFPQSDTIYTLQSESQAGFNLGIVADMHMGPHFDLRAVPALVFGQRDLEYMVKINDNLVELQSRPIESTYMELPLALKYKSARVGNGRAYLLGGAKLAYDLASLKDVDQSRDDIVRLKKWDFTYQLGIGADIYFEYFKFSPQIKLDYGFYDLLVRDGTPFTSNIDRLTTRSFVVSISFEG